MQADLEKRLKRAQNLPSPPGVALRIIELAQDPTADLGQIADIISCDPAMSVKLLRIANSPLYALRRRCDNLQQALSLLGLNSAMTLALSFSMVRGLQGEEAHGLDYNFFWRRSVLAAAAARCLARQIKRGEASEELFLGALLQDIGILALNRIDPEIYQYPGAFQRDHNCIVELERQRIGEDHAAIGQWLLESWQIPVPICNAVGYSHNPNFESPDPLTQQKARCLALSGLLADVLLTQPKDAQTLPEELVHIAGQSLALESDDLKSVVGTMRGQVPELQSLFEMELLTESDLEAITDQAREAVMVRNLQMLEEVRQLRSAAENLEQRAQLAEERGRRDALTGRFNRAYLDKAVEEEFRRAEEQGWPLSVAFADLDFFKGVNDTHGHAIGDQVLKKAAELIDMQTRKADLVARYGGEEFVILLPGSDGHTTKQVADRIVSALRDYVHEASDGRKFRVTVSIGIASQNTHMRFQDSQALLEAADQALYAAKSGGKDQAVVYGQKDSPKRPSDEKTQEALS